MKLTWLVSRATWALGATNCRLGEPSRVRGGIASLAALCIVACDHFSPKEESNDRDVSAFSLVRTPSSAASAPWPRAVSASPAKSLDASVSSPVSVGMRRIVWDFPGAPGGELRVLVVVPARESVATRLPVLVALHGKGESLKGPLRGARGWLDDYELARAMGALVRGKLGSTDYHGLVGASRLGEVNRALAASPFRGMIIVMPFTPHNITGSRPFSATRPYGRFLVENVLARVYRETPAMGTAVSTGIDGVSLGGRIALLVGLSFPSSFGAVGSLQAAVDLADVPKLVALAQSARQANPGLALRLLTSEGDFYRRPIEALSGALRRAGIRHQFRLSAGPHDYEFNRGPGAIEMLLFHDRALRRFANASQASK